MTASKEGFRHRHVAVADSLLYVVEGGTPMGYRSCSCTVGRRRGSRGGR
jgi:hypothetical protein